MRSQFVIIKRDRKLSLIDKICDLNLSSSIARSQIEPYR
ncbi:hypothetical protein APA_3724 [Pseudanabaena sp. lw0831]|nr:hypothetical protein APA_3724 [Pseudanabaena sp. lw0831]